MNGDEYNDDSDIDDEENPMDADQYQSNESLNEDEEQRSQKQRQEDENDQNMDSEYESSDRQHQILDQNCIDQFQQPNQDRITSPFLTKYEKARILGVRAIQISKNSPLYVSFGDNHNLDPLIIAEKQLHDGKIPFIVRRYLPDGTFEDWKLSELKTFD